METVVEDILAHEVFGQTTMHGHAEYSFAVRTAQTHYLVTVTSACGSLHLRSGFRLLKQLSISVHDTRLPNILTTRHRVTLPTPTKWLSNQDERMSTATSDLLEQAFSTHRGLNWTDYQAWGLRGGKVEQATLDRNSHAICSWDTFKKLAFGGYRNWIFSSASS